MVNKKQIKSKKNKSTKNIFKNIFKQDAIFYLIIVIAIVLIFNQFQLFSISSLTGNVGSGSKGIRLGMGDSLSNVDVTQIQSTAQGVALLFPIQDIKTTQDAINIMISTGTPDYGEEMGVSYDDPVTAMDAMARAYPTLKTEAKKNNEVWQKYLSLAAQPRGISCEFCCGVGPQGVDASGNLRCGCKHNVGVQSLTLWLLMNTDYSDAEILKEVYKWKSIFFPKNMVGLANQIAGGDTSVLEDLPGMVGGC